MRDENKVPTHDLEESSQGEELEEERVSVWPEWR